ncbi:MAG: O-methyltransferase [Pseudonocardia sp.]|nr:O-methyltransferase [Pseudonocardia sp.]
MTKQSWAEVDHYYVDLLLGDDPVLDAARAASETAGLPSIAVSPVLGKMLSLLASTQGARRILEVGTLGGYSTIWLARALPSGGKLITLELAEKHADVARTNLERAGLDKLVEVRVGPALDTLATLADEHPEPFDLVFIDADKENYAEYFRWALRLTQPGALIIIDNVVHAGAVLDQGNTDPRIEGTRRLAELVAASPTVSATVVQTVGVKGHDGFLLARVDG